ncbi:MAG: amidohydrolase family protein [Clostridia bacterium]|nr:amidohydrolase family protein [Clostridia bacterium]
MLGDCHIHMILDGVYYRAAIDAQKENPDEALIRSRLQAYRDADILYLRDGGDAWGVGRFAARLAPEYGIEYRTPVFPIHKKGRYGGFIGKGFDTMAEYRALVREADEQGADFIKIMISGLMDFDRYGVITSQALTPAEIREMISIAHGEGFAVMAHANGADTVKAAIDAGVDSIEHGAYLDASSVEMLARSGCIWCPTLVTIANLVGDGRFPDEVLVPLRDLHMKNIADCARMGGKIAPGSDNGAYRVPHVQGTMDEYMHLKRAVGEGVEDVLARGMECTRRRFVRK